MNILLLLTLGLMAILQAVLVYRTNHQAHSLKQLRAKLAVMDVRVATLANKVESPSAKVVDTKKMFL